MRVCEGEITMRGTSERDACLFFVGKWVAVPVPSTLPSALQYIFIEKQ